MRILRLDLMAFGPFTNTTLGFGASGTPLHIVYGPNEAGKSSCLRGLRAWLYGIPAQNNDDFLHSYSNMRIAGWIEGSGGEKLEFIRRKGKSKTLRAMDDLRLIEDSELNRFLKAVDQNTFEQRFAFDYQELQRGGEQIAKGTGHLAEILFSASAGITHLRDVQKSLEEQIQGLFKSRGTNSTINIALQELKESRDRLRDCSLATADWESQSELLAEAQQRLIDITEQLGETRTSQLRFGRLVQALPILRKLEFSQGLLEEVEQAPLLPLDFGERRAQAIDRCGSAEQRLREAQAEINRLQSTLREVTLPEAVLQYRSVITGLHTELGSYQKAAKDRPRLIAEMLTLKSQAEKLCARIGWEPDLKKAAEFRLPLLLRKRIDSLASEWTALSTRLDELLKIESRLREELEKLESEADSQFAPFNLEELKQNHRRALRHADSENRSEQLRRISNSVGEEVRTRLARLPHFQGSIERLVELTVPLKETIERFHRDWRECDDQISKRNERIEDLNQRIGKLGRKIEKLQLKHELPTEDDLRIARERRESGWQLLRCVITGERTDSNQTQAVAEFVKAQPGTENLLNAFAASVEYADSIADRLRREALQVSEKSNWTSEQHELQLQLSAEQAHLNQAKLQRQSLVQHWQEAWQMTEIHPLNPEEMLAWVQNRDELVARYHEHSQTQADLNQLEIQITGLMQNIQSNLARSVNAHKQPFSSLAEAIEYCEATIREIDSANQRTIMRLQSLDRIRLDLSKTVDDRRQLEEKIVLWRQEWSASVRGIGQPADIRPNEAQELLREIEQISVTLGEMDVIRSRVVGIDRDSEEFSAKVRLLLSHAAPDLDVPVDQAIVDIHHSLQEALATQSKVQEWQEQLVTQLSRNEKANADLAYWQEELQSLCSMAGCENVDHLAEAEHRSRQRQQVEQEIRSFRESLIELAGSEPLQEFLDCVRHADADQLASEFQRLGERIVEQETEKAEAAKAVGARQADLNRMDGSVLASQAHEDVHHHLSSIRSKAEQYIRLRLAEVLLKKAIERFREANQGPLLSRASQFFAALTLGSFSGLRADFDDQGRAVLVGIRGDSNTSVGVSGMSTGTCDQLYMALRLAMIESHAREHFPMPLIIDDVLIQFDDQRSKAALRLLSELAEQTQVIYFTHHQRIVELAEQSLESTRYVVHNLARCSLEPDRGDIR